MLSDDQAARERAINPSMSFCVSAPAGSGKTELLTQRLLALLARVDRPEQVLAITFTRKAASEMAARIMEKLEQASADAPIEAAHERVTRDLAQQVLAHAQERSWRLDESSLNLRTIDSFCHELTRQMPILSGMGGIAEPVDNAVPLYERAVSDFLHQASVGKVGESISALLGHFDNRWNKVSDLLVALLSRRGDWGPHIGQHHDPTSAEHAIESTVADLVNDRLDALSELFTHDTQELCEVINGAREVLALSPITLTHDAEALEGWRAVSGAFLTNDLTWRKARGINAKQGFQKDADLKERFLALLARYGDSEPLREALIEVRYLPNPLARGQGWQLVVLLSSLLPVLQAHLLLAFQRTGTVDHTHIALAASQALGGDEQPTALAERLDYQLEHILVDEFQDTSSSQAEFLRRLTRGWAEHNATGAMPRTLFIVGDGMQSIYGFRYADVRLFLQIRQNGLAGLTLEALTLSQNFRSRPAVVSWVNRVFSDLMGKVDDINIGRVSHVRAISAKSLDDTGVGEGVDVVTHEEGSEAEEATFIADTVTKLRQTHPSATIAVLVRAKKHADPVMDALSSRDIPVSGEALQSLADRSVIQDLMALCSWLANPADNIAALTLLRSPWCGLDLGSIDRLLIDQPERPFDLLKLLTPPPGLELEREAVARITHLKQALEWGQSKRDRLALPVWLEQIWLRLEGPVSVLPSDLSSVYSFFECLRRAERAGIGLDVEWLSLSLSDVTPGTSEADNPIRIMSFHKAKGLEFDYVFMPSLHRRTRPVQRELLRWHWHGTEQAGGLLIAADDQEKEDRSLYNYLNWLQKQKDSEELKRLLYVGVTRARRRAVLSGCAVKPDDGDDFTAPTGSMLGLLTNVINDSASPVSVEPATQTASVQTLVCDEDAPTAKTGLYRLSKDRLRGGGMTLPPEVRATAAIEPAPLIQVRSHRVERVTGVITHRILELLAGAALPAEPDDRIKQWIRGGLQQTALAADAMTVVEEHCLHLLSNTLSCPTGRWILGAHPEAQSELALSRMEAGELKGYVIDRTFLDSETGLRWVIDYKTSAPLLDEPIDSFIAREQAHYRDQLRIYAELLGELTVVKPHQAIKTALYFPSIKVLSTTL